MLVILAAPIQGAVVFVGLDPGAAQKAACPWLPSAAPQALVALILPCVALPY